VNVKSLLISRFIKDKGERFPLISIFGVTGVFLGVFAIIVIISVMQGFESDMVKRLIGTQPHVYITDATNPMLLENWKDVLEKVSNDPELKKSGLLASPFVEGETVVYFNNVTIGGVVFSVSDQMFGKLTTAVPAHREVIVGEQLGLTNRMIKRDTLEILSAWDVAYSSSAIPKIRKFKILDFARTGTYARDLKYMYVNLDDGMKYFTPNSGFPTGIALLCQNAKDASLVAGRIKKIIPNSSSLKIDTWEDRNKKIFYSLKLERFAMLATLLFIVLVASFSIVTSLVLMVESKRKDFVILISMGLNRKELKRVILQIAFIKGAIGAISGGILGTLFCFLLQKYKFITLPAIYYDTHLPVSINIWFNITAVLFAVLISLAGSYFPLNMMSKFSPVLELRKN
jgi:lipoprotein-releasing system permease protein